jgi:hypothetical protein
MPKFKVTISWAQFEIEAADSDAAQQEAIDQLEDIEVEEVDDFDKDEGD